MSACDDDIPACIKTLSGAQEVYWDFHVTREDAKLSPVFGAYNAACKLGLDPRGSELDWLMRNGTPAAKIFCCFVAWELERDAGLERFESLIGDSTPVNYKSGCFGFPTTLNDIASEFVKNRKFHDFPSSV